jgi:hypothetical protein
MKKGLVSRILTFALLIFTGCVPEQQYNHEVQQNQQLLYLNSTYQQLNQTQQSEISGNQVQIRQLQDRAGHDGQRDPFSGGRVGPS